MDVLPGITLRMSAGFVTCIRCASQGLAPRRGSRALPALLVTGLLAACGGGGSGGDDGGGGGGTLNFAVTTATVGDGTISPTTTTVAGGATATFSVTPGSGSSIASVSGCGGVRSGSSYTTGPISSTCTVTATFSLNSYQVIGTAGQGGSISPATRTVQHGNTASFSLVPDAGYGIDAVAGCGGTLNGSTYTTGPITGNCSVTASFRLGSYQVTSTAGPGGSISPAVQTVQHGNTTSFTVSAETGYNIGPVTGCAGTLQGIVYTTGPVTSACTVSASFTPISYVVSAIAGPGGSISPSSRTVSHGDIATFTITADTGFVTSRVSGCNGYSLDASGSSYTSIPITGDCSISVSFGVFDPDDPMIMVVDTSLIGAQTRTVELYFPGRLDALIDWGDGTESNVGGASFNYSHTYAVDGEYTVRIFGLTTEFPVFENNTIAALRRVLSFGSTGLTGLEFAFKDASNLVEVPPNIPRNVTSLLAMFWGAGEFNGEIDTWDVSAVFGMALMFQGASSFNQPIGNWNVSAVTDMQAMFLGASSFNQPIGNWDVTSVTDMGNMFGIASSFNQPIGNWDVGAVVDMLAMFYGASSFDQPIGDWNVSSVAHMSSMFQGASSFNQSIGNWDVSSVAHMSSMFQGASSFNQSIGNWDVSAVTNMEYMFYGASSFNQPIGNWDVSAVTDMGSIFLAASSFNQPIGDWSVSSVANMSSMFQGASSFNQPIGNWTVSSVTNMHFMFLEATSFNQPIGNWNVSAVTDMSGMLRGASSFDQPIGNWNVSAVTDMRSMFEGASSFDQPIGDWNVSSVTDMAAMFYVAGRFNQNLSSWCVVQIPSAPGLFDVQATSWVLARPNWGAPCAPGGNGSSEALAYLVSQAPSGGTVTLQPGVYLVDSFVVERDLTIAAAPGEGRVTLEYVGFDEAFITLAGAGTQLTLEGVDLRTQMQGMIAFITDDGLEESGSMTAGESVVRLIDVTMHAPGGHAIYSRAPGATYLIEGGAYITGRSSFVVINGAELTITLDRGQGTVIHASAFQPVVDRPHGVRARDLQVLSIDGAHFATDGPHIALVGDLAWGLLRDNDYQSDKAAVVLIDSEGNLLEDLSGRAADADFAIDGGDFTPMNFEVTTGTTPRLWRTAPPRAAHPVN